MFDFSKRPIRSKRLFYGAALLIWVGVVVGTLWIKGYQPQGHRSFTDEEMCRITVQRGIQRILVDSPKVIRIPSDDGSNGETYKQIFVVPYRNVDHFLKENPECCYLSGKPNSILVEVMGVVSYTDASGQIVSSEKRFFMQSFSFNIRYLP